MAPPTDPQARFELLFESSYEALLRYAARRCPDRVAAEDLVADVLLVAWRRISEVPPGERALPWLYAVAAHQLRNDRRAAARAVDKTRRAQAEPGPAPRDPADRVAGSDAALQALAALSEADRETLCLVAWEGLSFADAARAAGVNRAAFTARFYRARRRLAAQLDRDEHPLPQALEQTA